MVSASTRTFLGAAAGALSMLLFHQTTIQIFFWFGLAPHPGFSLGVVPPFGVPRVVSACFWAALIGAVYGAVMRRPSRHPRLTGVPLGVVATLLVWFVVLPLHGDIVAYGGQVPALIRSAVASLMWGLGVGILFPLLLPKRLDPSRKDWAGRQIHA